MPAADDNLADLERQRLELEKNVRQLQQSLYHWRLWEAEYDGLKEEIASLRDDSTKADLLNAGREFGGTLVNEAEIQVLLGEGQGLLRSKEQVVQLLTRRIDYVKQNVSTMEKRLQIAEDKLNDLLSVERPSVASEDGWPVTEIMEQLDEEGRVLSSSTSAPGERAPELLDVLRKAGLKDIPDRIPTVTSKTTTTAMAELDESKPDEEGNESEGDQETSQLSQAVQKHEKQEKPASSHMNGASSNTATNSTPASIKRAVEERDGHPVPVTDADESPEDAKLRREMLAYGLNEVGAVVAELELDEDGSEISIEEDYDSYEEYDVEDEEEDEYGRNTRRVLTENYHQKMRELEEKLKARGMQNIGRDISSLPEEMRRDLEEPRVVKIEKAEETPQGEEKPKKKVAFAEELDIAPEPAPPVEEKRTMPREPEVNPISDSIVERTQLVKEESHSETKAPKKTSRFKSARFAGTAPPAETTVSTPKETCPERRSLKEKSTATPVTSLPLFPAKPRDPKPFSQPIISDVIDNENPSRSEPRPPQGKTLADTLVEREVSEGSGPPPEPERLDEQLHRQEIATEFYKMSNRMIHRNGGFLNDDEQETIPLDDDDDAHQPKNRVSRFMAARMR